MADMIFCMASTQSHEEKEGKEGKKEKSHFRSNLVEPPYTGHLGKKRTMRRIK